MSTSLPQVFVIDDDTSVRTALARLLRATGFQVQKFASAEAFLNLPPVTTPACALVDVNLPGMGGLELQRKLMAAKPTMPVIIITGQGDIPTSVRAMKAGAMDFLTKPIPTEVLLQAVREALAWHAQHLQEQIELACLRQRADTLTVREREVMALVVTGMANKQAGSALGVCEKTIKAHRGQVMRKMAADSLPMLVRMAEKLGIAGIERSA